MAKRMNALHKSACRSVYWATYYKALGDADGAEFAMQRLAHSVELMRRLGEDVSVEDYLNA